mgnify:CR=1 FL=1
MVIVKLGQHVAMTAKEDASERTRSRIQEQGSAGFVVRDHLRKHPSFSGGPGLFVESLVDKGRKGERWMGWLPLEEIETIQPWGV